MQTHTGSKGRFQSFATRTGEIVGSSGAFIAAVVIVVTWAVSGPVFDYSNTWQLWINTGTTVVTFLMVFLIQYTQNRDTRALHLKLDELLRAMDGARTEMVDLKDLSDEELTRLETAFSRLARFAGRSGAASLSAAENEAANPPPRNSSHLQDIAGAEVPAKPRVSAGEPVD